MSIAEQHHDYSLATRTPRHPNSHAVLARPRMTALMTTGSAAALCIVRGPRSSGKSVALRHWSADTSKDVLWLTLTQQITAHGQFWREMHAALSTQMPVTGAPGNDLSLTRSPVRFIATRLAGTAPVTLILEDFYWVQGLAVEEGLLELLECAPQLSLIIMTRSALAVESQQISRNIDLHVIDPAHLRFSAGEAAQFHAGTTLESISAELNERFLGAPVLHRTARQVSGQPRQQHLPFAQEIIQKVTNTLRHEYSNASKQWLGAEAMSFVSATLPLTHFDLPLAQRVAPHAPAESVIRELAESGVLWSQEASGSTTFGYPGIVRDVLENFLAEQVAAHKSEVLATAAAVEFARQAYLPAFRYAVDNNDLRLSSSMLVNSGLRLLFQGGKEFFAILKRVPTSHIAKYPLLSFSLGLMYIAERRTRLQGLEYFGLALASSKPLGKSLPAEEKFAVDLVRAVALRLTGQFKMAAAASRSSMMGHAERPLSDRDRLDIFETMALGQWGLSLVFVGDFGKGTQALQRSVAAAEHVGCVPAAFFATSLLAYRYALDGDLRTAAQYAQWATDMNPDANAAGHYQRTPLAMSLAMIELGRFRPDAAAQHLEKVITEASTSEFWGRLRIIEAQIDMLRGRSGLAVGRLNTLLTHKKELPSINPVDASALGMLGADLLLTDGHASGAAKALGALPAKDTATVVGQARLSLATGQPATVVELLSAPLRFSTILQSVEAQVLLTVARLHMQPAVSVRTEIQRIVGAITTLETQWPLGMLQPEDLGLLLTAAQELGVPWPEFSLLAKPLIPASMSLITLTPRETAILAALAATGDRTEIARLNFVSVNTVKSQLHSLYKKLGVASREQALLVAHREKLLGF